MKKYLVKKIIVETIRYVMKYEVDAEDAEQARYKGEYGDANLIVDFYTEKKVEMAPMEAHEILD